MARSHHVDETRTNAVERPKRQRRPNVEKGGAKRRTLRESAVRTRSRTKLATGKQTKQQTFLLLSRPEGATVEVLQVATGWHQHSVRGFLAGAVKKKLGLTLLSEKPDAGPRRYCIAGAV
jgi:hypothetical protein